MFNFDRQKVILFIAKWISYVVNTLIILALLAFVAWWGQQLFLSAQLTDYHRH